MRCWHKIISVFFIGVLMLPSASDAITLKQRQLGSSVSGDPATIARGGNEEEIPGTEGMSEMQVVAMLKKDIELLDEEIASCNKKRKGWVAATIVGGVGTVGTGVAALVQNSHRKDKKAEIQNIQSQIQTTEQQIGTAQQQLNSMK